MKQAALLVLLALTCLGFSQQYAPKPTAPDKIRLASLEKAYDVAGAAYKKHPKDAAAKKAFVTAAVKYGHECMISPVLDRKVKYRQALHVYREVLAIDPKNPVAKPESDMIISIYKSMGRPIPQG